jgi:hypothetical protein
MKRSLLISLIFIYLFSALGVSAKSVYCCGVLKSTQVNYNPSPKKADCKMAAMMKHCCKTKKQYFKVNDQHFYSGTLDLLVKLFPVLSRYTSTDTAVCASVTLPQQSHCSNAPPAALKTPAYLLNCNYRI